MSEQTAISKKTAQTVEHGGVLAKLIIFSISLAVVPIASYFLSEKYLWDGNSTFAALTAVVAANMVLIAYITQSVAEENAATVQTPAAGSTSATAESKKSK